MTQILIYNINHALKYSDICSSCNAVAKMHFLLIGKHYKYICYYKSVASSIKVAQSRQHLMTKYGKAKNDKEDSSHSYVNSRISAINVKSPIKYFPEGSLTTVSARPQ